MWKKKNKQKKSKKKKAGMYKDIPWLTLTHTSMTKSKNKMENDNNKTNVQTSWSRCFIIKWWPEGRGSMMRKHWIVPCSVIKWWLDGVRGREKINTGLCAPGHRNIVRRFKQYRYLWEKLLCKNKNGRQVAISEWNHCSLSLKEKCKTSKHKRPEQ